MEFLAVLCLLVLWTPGISAASTISATDQTPAPQAPAAAPAPISFPLRATPFTLRPTSRLNPSRAWFDVYPLDSWIYPAVMRLYGMGFVDTVFLGMRPWTRLSVAHMLEQSSDRITGSTNDEAIDIYTALEKDLQPDMRIPLDQKFGRVGFDSVYQRIMGIGGTPLRDSFIWPDRHQ